MSRFSGYSKAYGQFKITGKDDTGKQQGKAQTIQGEANEEHYRAHLSASGPGDSGLGIIMLRDDDTVVFGAIDNDDKKMHHVEAAAAIERYRLPLILCRSKSGGGHFYCFTKEPVPAAIMRAKLAQWASLLGMAATTEIFPKQTVRMKDRNDVGSWINLPYMGGDRTSRYAIDPAGQSLDLEQFLDLADRKSLTPEQLESFSALKVSDDSSELFYEAPPCLQVLHARGAFAEGFRNEGLFNVGIYLRKRFPDNWKQKLEEYKATLIGSDPTFTAAEVVSLTKSLEKKEGYSYKCKHPPINAYCNRRACLGQKYGVGEGSSETAEHYDIGGVTRYEPPEGETITEADVQWRMEVDGIPILISTQELLSPQLFAKACLIQANKFLIPMPIARWMKRVAELQATATVAKLPESATKSGMIKNAISQFARQGKADKWEAIPVTQGAYVEAGKAYFRSADLAYFLDTNRIRWDSMAQLWRYIESMKGGAVRQSIKSGMVELWFIPVDGISTDAPLMAIPDRTEVF